MDGAFSSEDVIDLLEAREVEYAIKAPFYEWLGLKEGIVKRRRRVGATVECFEQRLAVAAWSYPSFRQVQDFILLREKRYDPRHRSEGANPDS